MKLHLLLLLLSFVLLIQTQQNRQNLYQKNTKSRQQLATRINTNIQGRLGHRFGTEEGFELVQATPLSSNNKENQRDSRNNREDREEEPDERRYQTQRVEIEEEKRQPVENRGYKYQNSNARGRVEASQDLMIQKQIRVVPTIQMKSQIIQTQITPKNTPQIQTYTSSSSSSNILTPTPISSPLSPPLSPSYISTTKSLPPPPPPKTNLVRGAKNSIIGQQNMLDGNLNKIRGNLNVATGHKNAIHGSNNDVLANNALIHGSQNVVIQCLDEDQLY